jgi:predicted aspartyl protease
LICVSDPRQEALKKAGRPVPIPISVRALVDTGASCTCIDPAIIKRLGLSPIGKTQVHTPSTQGTAHGCNTYDASLVIRGQSGNLSIGTLAVVETGLNYQGFDAILGRNVLSRCMLFYNGPVGIVGLYF